MLPFRAFVLPPGRERFLELGLRMGSCAGWEPGSSLGIHGFHVRYRTLVFEREHFVVLHTPVKFAFGRDCG
jgi:hypothetical protein